MLGEHKMNDSLAKLQYSRFFQLSSASTEDFSINLARTLFLVDNSFQLWENCARSSLRFLENWWHSVFAIILELNSAREEIEKKERERGRKAHWIRFVQRDYLPKQFGLCAFATWKYRNDSITVELTEIAKYILLFILEIRWNLLRAYRIQLLHLTFQCALSRLSLIFFLPKKIEFSILLSGMFLFADL